MIAKILRLRKRIETLFQERTRIEELKYHEANLFFSGFRCIAGLDEVGRGALAGPVVAAAVVIKNIDSFFISEIKDSKKISKKKREILSKLIIDKSSDIGIGIVDESIIDRINVLNATILAMKRAIGSLSQCPDYLLIDALTIPYIKIGQTSIIKGEDKSISIAAASIVAKVFRDNLMNNFHRKYPFYSFNENVGYGTRKHLIAIKKHGICPIHRKSYKGVSTNKIYVQPFRYE